MVPTVKVRIWRDKGKRGIVKAQEAPGVDEEIVLIASSTRGFPFLHGDTPPCRQAVTSLLRPR
jgi:hypothetical protein